MLGGAALTRSYVENDLAEVYEGQVSYARDAFEGLSLMDKVMAVKRGEAPAPDSPEALEAARKAAERKERHERSKRIAEKRKAAEAPVVVPARSDVAANLPVPTPPFWGTRVVKGIPLADYASLIDERALFLGQWGLRGQRGGDGPTYEELVETEGRPRLRAWLSLRSGIKPKESWSWSIGINPRRMFPSRLVFPRWSSPACGTCPTPSQWYVGKGGRPIGISKCNPRYWRRGFAR